MVANLYSIRLIEIETAKLRDELKLSSLEKNPIH